MHHGSNTMQAHLGNLQLGDAPALTQEQQDQNTAGTHRWGLHLE
jgi:hypothetical protein